MAREQCQMNGCDRQAEHTMSFKTHEDVEVCDRHYRRNKLVKYGVILALSVVMASLGLGVYLLLF